MRRMTKPDSANGIRPWITWAISIALVYVIPIWPSVLNGIISGRGDLYRTDGRK